MKRSKNKFALLANVPFAVAAIIATIVTPIAHAQAPAPLPRLRVLIVTGGHPFEEEAFFNAFRAMANVSFSHVRLGGEAERKLKPGEASSYDVLVFYDMNQHCDAYLSDLAALLESGKGAVFLHHALGSCPDNPEYEFFVGGRARFGRPPGSSISTSVFKPNISYRAHVEDATDPITAGLTDFNVTDEVYANFFVNTGARILLSTTNPASARHLAWSWQYRKSSVVYIQLGHDHETYENPSFRTLVERSILWVGGRLLKPPADSAAAGEKLYDALGCPACHGKDARGARGPDLRSPALWARSDAKSHVVDVIKSGVKGTEMPSYAKAASDSEIGELVRFLAGSGPAGRQIIQGDARHGRSVFVSTGCAGCHGPAGRGTLLGPDLKPVVDSKSVRDLTRDIRTSRVDVPFHYEAVSVVTKEGRRLSGIRRNEDTFSLQMVDRSGRLHLFVKDDLRQIAYENKSLMPAYPETGLPAGALMDILAYLQNPNDRP